MRMSTLMAASLGLLAISLTGCASKSAVALRTESSNVTAYDSRDLTRAADVGVIDGEPSTGVAMTPATGTEVIFDGDGGDANSILAYQPPQPPPVGGQTMAQDAAALIAGWPEASRTAAQVMIAAHGQPGRTSSDTLVWENNGPWVKTIVHRAPTAAETPEGQHDVLEQSIRYRVPADRLQALAGYDASLMVDATAGLLTARSNNQEMNVLALNLAHEIITGRKTVAEATHAHHDAVQALTRGEQPAITQQLQFEVEAPASPTAARPDSPQ